MNAISEYIFGDRYAINEFITNNSVLPPKSWQTLGKVGACFGAGIIIGNTVGLASRCCVDINQWSPNTKAQLIDTLDIFMKGGITCSFVAAISPILGIDPHELLLTGTVVGSMAYGFLISLNNNE